MEFLSGVNTDQKTYEFVSFPVHILNMDRYTGREFGILQRPAMVHHKRRPGDPDTIGIRNLKFGIRP